MKMIVHTSDIPFHIKGFGTVKTADSVIFKVILKWRAGHISPPLESNTMVNTVKNVTNDLLGSFTALSLGC